jgi:hypothetical protein
MFEIVEAIHKAFRIESTWQFVLLVAVGAALAAGFLAWVVDTGYRNSPEYKQEHSLVTQTPLLITNPASNEASPKELATPSKPALENPHTTPSTPAQPQSTSSVTNPVGSIVNQNSPNFGTQSVTLGEIPDPPLLLTDQQCSSISAALSPFKGQTVTIQVSGSMVGDPFGKKLQAAIEQAGLIVQYQAAYTVIVQGIGAPPRGLSFSFGKNRKDILNAMTDQFGKLRLVNKDITAFDLGNGDDVANVFCVFVSPLK